jgi:outer membrane protein
MLRSFLAVILVASLANAQKAAKPAGSVPNTEIAPLRPSGSIFFRPYKPVETPAIRTSNSRRLADLIVAGQLHLTVQDAILLALENNIDVEIARYGPIVSDWRLQRAEAGGALPGVPSAASQVGQVAAGQGVTGSQNSAGVAGGGNGGGNNQNANNATISQIGPVTQNLDPAFQETSTFSHVSTPQANTTQSAVSNLISNTRTHNGSMQQGLLSGGAVTIRFSQNYLNENSPTNLLNPTVAPNLQFSFQHSLGSGFGRRVNARNITIAKINRGIADLTFETRVIDIVNQVLDLYWNLAAAYEDQKAKTTAAETARTLLGNVQRQVELGSAAPPDLISANTEVVNTGLAAVNSQTSMEQQELRLKSLLSRNGLADKALLNARIIPIDRMEMPASDNLPPMADLIKEAQSKRIDIISEKTSLQTIEESTLGTRSGLLPNVQAFGNINQVGLAGTERLIPGSARPDPKFVGGTGTALGQVFGFDFQTRRIGVFASVPLKNRQAQADYSIDILSLRQNELNQAKHFAQIEVDVASAISALQQARVRHEYAVKNRTLQEELLKAEQKKFEFGASRPYDVIQQRRDLANAQSAEVTAMANYVRSRISLERTLGRTLESNRISIATVR